MLPPALLAASPLAAGRPGPGVQVERLVDGAQVPAVGEAAAERRLAVFDAEHRLAGRRPSTQPGRALFVLEALLVDREVEVRLERAELVEVVLERDAEA